VFIARRAVKQSKMAQNIEMAQNRSGRTPRVVKIFSKIEKIGLK
jgi:hypothetical protein